MCKSYHPPPRLLFSALLEAQEIFGLDFDPAELDQLAKEGLGSDEEEGEEGEEEREEEVRRYLQCTTLNTCNCLPYFTPAASMRVMRRKRAGR